MLIKKCKNCDQVYSAQPRGRHALLCRGCALDCEGVCFQVLKFLRTNPEATVEDIANNIKTPVIFAQILVDEGRFKSTQADIQKSDCKKCGKELQTRENRVCADCGEQLKRQIHKLIAFN